MAEERVNRFFIIAATEGLASLHNSGYNRSPMEPLETFNNFPQRKRSHLFEICILFSLLLHLGLVALLNSSSPLVTDPAKARDKATIVRLVDKPRDWELDTPPAAVQESRPTEPARRADRNQKVEKEQAPKGLDSRDQTAAPAIRPQTAQPAASKPAQQTKTVQAPPTPPAAKTEAEQPLPKKTETSEAERKTLRQQTRPDNKFGPTTAPSELPSLSQLTQLTPATIARSQSKGREEKIKEREGVEKGDTVWLNLENDLLTSFFRRFRNRIEGVWNYPLVAVRNEIEGILLLKITIDREGELLDVELLRTSGSDLLDVEAIEAVYRGAPFGPLPSHYSHPELKIFAHFRYILTGKYIYGRQ